MKRPIEFPTLNMPSDLDAEQMPDLLRYWYLGTRARRHMMLRRFAEVDAALAGIDEKNPDTAGGLLRAMVLDVGSAWGFNVMALASAGYRVTGMDLVVDQFEIGGRIAAENDIPMAVIGADVARLPFRDERFDAVTMVETLEHVFIDDRQHALGECRRVLRPGGRLIISTPNYGGIVERFKRFTGRHRWLRSALPAMCYPEEETRREDYHPYRYHHPLPDEEIYTMLETGGFDVVSIDHFLFMLKNVPDGFYPVVSGLERLFEFLPGMRRLAATTRFIAKKR